MHFPVQVQVLAIPIWLPRLEHEDEHRGGTIIRAGGKTEGLLLKCLEESLVRFLALFQELRIFATVI